MYYLNRRQPVVIRPGRATDVAEIVRMSKDFTDAAKLPFDNGSAIKFVSGAIADWDKTFIVSEFNFRIILDYRNLVNSIH